jgi:hypothetical protein
LDLALAHAPIYFRERKKKNELYLKLCTYLL